jgi:quercetin dioxygenase-like cupin family protein
VGYSISSYDELGKGHGFRKVRRPLGVTAFGVNFISFPPRYEGPEHFHDVQDELYLVFRGAATFTIDGKEHAVGEGGVVHIEASTPRRISNRTGEDLIIYAVGGKDGYVDRDGHVTGPEELVKRQGLS